MGVNGDLPNGSALSSCSAGVFAFLKRDLLRSEYSHLSRRSILKSLRISFRAAGKGAAWRQTQPGDAPDRRRDALCTEVSHILGFRDKKENAPAVKTSRSSWSLKFGQGNIWIPLPDKAKPNGAVIKSFLLNLPHQHSSHSVSLETQWNPVGGSHGLGDWKEEKQWTFCCGHCK